MLVIKDWNTAHWGLIRTAAESYPCHPKVNAFVGPSGGGKTTLMDALRITLGDAKFENHREMGHYIYPKSNWAVVKVAFWNRVDERRPFVAENYRSDEVSVCVRLFKNAGKCDREYYVFDGPFDNLADLGQNPRNYRERLVKYNAYLQLIERAGVTASFRKLMTLRPEEVQYIVDKDPFELFDTVFELKGQKKIQERHDEISAKVGELEQLEVNTIKDLREAELKLVEYEENKRKYEENEARKVELQKINTLLLKRQYWDAKTDLDSLNKEMEKAQQDKNELINEREKLNLSYNNVKSELDHAGQEKSRLEDLSKQSEEQAYKCSEYFVEINTQLKGVNREIETLEAIKAEPLNELEKSLEDERQLFNSLGVNREKLNQEIKAIKEKLSTLAGNKLVLPPWVQNYQNALKQNSIPAIMLANCISIKEEYIKWTVAIEAYLGRERYRTVVEKPFQLETRKLQEKYEYGARICLPSKSKYPVNSKLLHGKYVSLRSALIVENEESIGGYLDYLNNVYLVEDVEEGLKLQAEGYITLTQKGLLQDDDGSLFLRTKDLVLGGPTQKILKENLLTQLSEVQDGLNKVDNDYKEQNEKVEALRERIHLQKERLKLPNKLEIKDSLLKEFKKAEVSKDEARKAHDEVIGRQKAVWERITSISQEMVRVQSEIGMMDEKIQSKENSIKGYQGSIKTVVQLLSKAISDLKENNFDSHAIEFIEVEVKNDHIFQKRDGTEWTESLLKDRQMELRHAIELNNIDSKVINAGIIVMVEQQKLNIDRLNQDLEKAREDRREWQVQLDIAKSALKIHVKETMEQYIEEFTEMASLLGAKASGKFEQNGDDYLQWKLHLKIGFDGKEPKPYFDPGLSKGQRAAVSIMLLLAAVNNSREGTKCSVMFLDEPTSRVDDYRANEIGLLLQKTNMQYFITHQISASLNTVEWVDVGYITSKFRPEEQDYADNIVVETRRLVV
ncbi:MAG: hypothetical protein AB2421_14105 [Thermotaleaceae bacterium]